MNGYLKFQKQSLLVNHILAVDMWGAQLSEFLFIYMFELHKADARFHKDILR